MALDMFLKLEAPGLSGESNDKKHAKEIDVLAWSWGLSQSGTFHTGSGGGAGKVNGQDLNLTKYIDTSSCKLAELVCTGEHIPKATLTIRKAGGKEALEYLVYKLEKVMVTSLSTGGSGGEDRLTENISLNFAKIEVEYKEQDDKTGGGKQAGLFNYSFEENTK